jgi:hypothetical protein
MKGIGNIGIVRDRVWQSSRIARRKSLYHTHKVDYKVLTYRFRQADTSDKQIVEAYRNWQYHHHSSDRKNELPISDSDWIPSETDRHEDNEESEEYA